MTSSAQTPEPTDEQRAVAARAFHQVMSLRDPDAIAQALADQAAKIHARYADIADGLVADNPRRQWIADAIKTIGQGPWK